MMGNLSKHFTEEELKKIHLEKDLYLKAKMIVDVLFKDQKDKAGKPYIGHLYRVSEKLYDNNEKIAALLHDTLEDTAITENDLVVLGIPTEIIEIVKLVTKPEIDTSNMTKEEKLKLYSDEIDSIINSGNIHAIRLKLADMSDNYNKDRLKELPPEKQQWFEEKYGKQLIKLMRVTERKKKI